MITFEKIIEAEFVNADPEQIIRKISVNGFYSYLQEAIEMVNAHLRNQEQEIERFGTVQLTHIASSTLIRINTYLKTVEAEGRADEKKELEYLLGNIYGRLLKMVIKELPQENWLKFVYSIHTALHETCTLFQYDFDKLMQFLQILSLAKEMDMKENATAAIIPTKEEIRTVPSYIWIGPTDGFDQFLCAVRELKITADIDAFAKLFKHPTENLALNLDTSRRVYVLQFFVFLHDADLVSASGGGFYQVLLSHVKGFGDIFLNTRPVHRRTQAVKKLRSWNAVSQEFDKIFKEFT